MRNLTIKELKETRLTNVISKKESRKAYKAIKRAFGVLTTFWFFGQIVSIDWQAKEISLVSVNVALRIAGIPYTVIDAIEI